MELEELIVEIVIGLFLLFISYQIGIKENITLLHGYHYTQLDPKDKKVFTKKIGIGTLLVSIGILVMPIINLISHSELGYYIGLILIVVGVFYIIFIIVKYNGKLISFTDIEKRVHAIADKLGIRDILSKFPYEVSGGQKQRCACARALINEPKLILADEPTGALDSKASRLLLETMSEINKKMQATILMVTHDPFSASFCERILFLKDGKIFNEIFRGEKSRKDFFNEILDILTLLGGEVGNVR